MKITLIKFVAFLAVVGYQPVMANEQDPAISRIAHAADLEQRFGQALNESRQHAAYYPIPGTFLVETIQGVGDCGNSVLDLDLGEKCDDGNSASGDGCSDICLIEAGYNCSDPIPADLTNLLADPGFEGGPMGGFWDESSTTLQTPICDANDCGLAGQRSGDYWAWFGGVDAIVEEASLSQQVSIPATATELRFWLAVPSCYSAADFLEVLIDDQQAWVVLGDDAACGDATYVEKLVDISNWADGQQHKVEFHGKTDTPGGEFTDFFLDDVYLAQGPLLPTPSVCQFEELIFLDGFESMP